MPLPSDLFDDAPKQGKVSALPDDLFDEPKAQTNGITGGDWTPTQHGFKVRPISTPDSNIPTVQREDGAIWYGKKQGNKGLEGWFNQEGKRVPTRPGAVPVGVNPMDILGQGATDLPVKLAQLGAHAVGSSAVDPYVTQRERDFQAQYGNGHGVSLVRMAGSVMGLQGLGKVAGAGLEAVLPASGVVVPGASRAKALMDMANASRTGRVLTTIGRGAATGAAVAPLATPDAGVQSPKEFWDRQIKEMGLGGAMGAAGSAGILAASWLAPKVANALAGTKLGDRFGIKTKLNPKYAGGPGNMNPIQRAEELESVGIKNTTPGDVTGDLALRKVEDSLSRNEPRMMEYRQGTSKQAAAYADEAVGRLETAVKETGWRGIDDLEAAVAKGGKRSKEAATLLNALNTVGDDTRQIVKKSGSLELLTRKLKADANYDALDKMAEGAFSPNNMFQSVGKAIKEIERVPGSDKSLLPYYKELEEQLAKPNGGPLSWADARSMRTILNGKRSGLDKPGTVVQDANANRAHLDTILEGLEKDQTAFTNKQGPEFKAQAEKATKQYLNEVVPAKAKDISTVMSDEDPLKLLNLFNGKNEYEQKRMLSLLEPKGWAALQAEKLGSIVRQGGKIQKGTLGTDFNPGQVANLLKKELDAGNLDVIFPGPNDKWSPQGMIRMLTAVDRVSNMTGAATTTGLASQELGAISHGGWTTRAFEAAERFLTRENLLKLHLDPKGRALLVRASSLKPDSPMMRKLITEDAPKVLGLAAGKIAKPTEEAEQ